MNVNEKSNFYLHSLMCTIGGFLGIYAILNRGGNLGSAQTGNLLMILISFLGHKPTEFLLRICGMLLYLSAIEIYVFLNKKTKIHIQRYSILVDIFGVILLCFIPATSDPVLGLLPIFFMMATQWSVFHGTAEYASSTIFSTNNFRQTALALGEYFYDRDKKQLAKAKYFSNSLLWYHIGAILSFFTCKRYGTYACLFCLLPATISLGITLKGNDLPQLRPTSKELLP